MKTIFYLLPFILFSSCSLFQESFCPPDYEPVCGDDYITYLNSCFARNNDMKNYTEGGCPRQAEAVINYIEDCGYFINIMGVYFLPDQLNPEFQEDQMEVWLYFRDMGRPQTCELREYFHMQVLNMIKR
jgi:hypothetical protein